MADKDKSRTTQTSLQDGSLTGSTGVSQGTTTTASQSASTASAAVGTVKDSISGMASQASSSVKENGARLVGEAKQYAGDMAGVAKEKSRTIFDQKKEAAVGQVDSIVHAIRGTAESLQASGQVAPVAKYVTLAADQLDTFSQSLRQKDLDTLISDTQNLARRSPGAFFAGTLVAGFLLSRFLKSSSQIQPEPATIDTDDAFSSTLPATDKSVAATSAVPVATDAGTLGTAGTSTTSGTGTGTGSTVGTALGTTSTGALPSSLGSSTTGGKSL